MEIENNVFINGQKLTDIKREENCRFRITENGDKIRHKDINKRSIECSECKVINEISQFIPARHFHKNYLCQSCNKKGERNPFYNKNHDEETKKKINNNREVDYSGENNPMYGKNVYDILIERYGKEKADIIWERKYEKHSERMTGEENPFFGRTHDKKTIEKIKNANKVYWDNISLQDHLDRNNINIEKLKNILNFYVSEKGTMASVEKRFGLDFRTIEKYWIKSDLIEESKLEEIKNSKRFNSNPSSMEEKMYEKLVESIGSDRIFRQFKIGSYSYDFLIDGELLVEYDGYYWHEVVGNDNDEEKNKVAKQKDFLIYRVKEDENRSVDFKKEVNKIKNML